MHRLRQFLAPQQPQIRISGRNKSTNWNQLQTPGAAVPLTHDSSGMSAPTSAGGICVVPTTNNGSGTSTTPCAGSARVAPTADYDHQQIEGVVPSDLSRTNNPNNIAE